MLKFFYLKCKYLPKKLAGEPPYNEIMSIVAMAKPAPLTKQPILPSI